MEDHNMIKIALLGAAGSGKTSLARAIANRSFKHGYIPTIGADMQNRFVEDERLKIMVWDLAGDQRFSFIIQSYIPNSDMIVLTYDSNQYISYQRLLEKYKEFRPLLYQKPICVVSTKNDMNTGFKDQEWGRDLAIRLECPFFATSAMKNEIHEIINWILRYSHQKFFYYMKLEDAPKMKSDCPKFCVII